MLTKEKLDVIKGRLQKVKSNLWNPCDHYRQDYFNVNGDDNAIKDMDVLIEFIESTLAFPKGTQPKNEIKTIASAMLKFAPDLAQEFKERWEKYQYEERKQLEELYQWLELKKDREDR